MTESGQDQSQRSLHAGKLVAYILAVVPSIIGLTLAFSFWKNAASASGFQQGIHVVYGVLLLQLGVVVSIGTFSMLNDGVSDLD
jgi:heme A synthase